MKNWLMALTLIFVSTGAFAGQTSVVGQLNLECFATVTHEGLIFHEDRTDESFSQSFNIIKDSIDDENELSAEDISMKIVKKIGPVEIRLGIGGAIWKKGEPTPFVIQIDALSSSALVDADTEGQGSLFTKDSLGRLIYANIQCRDKDLTKNFNHNRKSDEKDED